MFNSPERQELIKASEIAVEILLNEGVFVQKLSAYLAI